MAFSGVKGTNRGCHIVERPAAVSTIDYGRIESKQGFLL